MHICRTIDAVRKIVAEARRTGRRINFVPTMGALHAGHLSLIKAARHGVIRGGYSGRYATDHGPGAVARLAAFEKAAPSDFRPPPERLGVAVTTPHDNPPAGRQPPFAVVSIFVNPPQFGPNEDFEKYPRNERADFAMCEKSGVDCVFIPAVAEVYPQPSLTKIHVERLTDTLCGPFRPGHFDGVATVVAKLFNIVGPDAAFFGEKDAQQLRVIRRMTTDLNLPIEIVGCPTLREPDGLALSSRNAYLSPDQRRRATCIFNALTTGRQRIESGEKSAASVLPQMGEIITASGVVTSIDYISAVDPEELQPVEEITAPILLAVALRIGATRLIDNMLARPPA